jgi:ssDNA-binding replication factor A large subunit
MLSVEELVSEISGKSGKSEDEVRQLIKDKQVELSNLVSEEGAAYIVGRELGVELIKETKRQLKISNIVPDMRNVDIVARVASVFDVREFEKNGKKGQVSSMILADDTGTIRLPLWNDEVSLMTSLGIRQNDVVEVTGAWAKRDSYRDGVELRLGKRGKIKVVEHGEVPGAVDTAISHSQEKGPVQKAARYDISALQPGMSAIVKGCLVQVYKKKPYFEVCPQCGGRPEENAGSFTCKEHGKVAPAPNLLLTGVVDDGTGNIRVVFFREQAEKIFGRGAEEVRTEFNNKGLDAFWERFPNLGKELMIEGRIKANELNKETELVANAVSEANVKEECKNLLAQLGV